MRGLLLIMSLLVLAEEQHVVKPGVTTQEVEFFSLKGPDSNERLSRKGLLVLRENAPATILILHFFGGDKFDVGPLRLLFKKYNVMTFDFRAHGENKNEQQSTIGFDEVYDVFGAVDFLKSLPEVKNKPLIIFGISMGASTALEALALDPHLADALFLDTPFATSDAFIEKIAEGLQFSFAGYEVTFLKDLVKKYAFSPFVQTLLRAYIRVRYGNLPVDTFVKAIYPLESIKKIPIPVFIVACKNDEKIPVAELEKLVDAHPGVTRLVTTGGRRHCDSLFYIPEHYKRLLNKFIKDVISKDIYKQPKKQKLEIMVDSDPQETDEDL